MCVCVCVKLAPGTIMIKMRIELAFGLLLFSLKSRIYACIEIFHYFVQIIKKKTCAMCARAASKHLPAFLQIIIKYDYSILD